MDAGTFILFSIVGAIVCAFIGSNMGARRNMGSTTGALLGFFLGVIGLLIIWTYSITQYDQSDRQQFQQAISPADELKKYKDLFDSGAINESEYNIQKGRILNL